MAPIGPLLSMAQVLQEKTRKQGELEAEVERLKLELSERLDIHNAVTSGLKEEVALVANAARVKNQKALALEAEATQGQLELGQEKKLRAQLEAELESRQTLLKDTRMQLETSRQKLDVVVQEKRMLCGCPACAGICEWRTLVF